MFSNTKNFKLKNYYKDGQLIGSFTFAESLHSDKIISERYNLPPIAFNSIGITVKKEY